MNGLSYLSDFDIANIDAFLVNLTNCRAHLLSFNTKNHPVKCCLRQSSAFLHSLNIAIFVSF